jgi:hypothetical protein
VAGESIRFALGGCEKKHRSNGEATRPAQVVTPTSPRDANVKTQLTLRTVLILIAALGCSGSDTATGPNDNGQTGCTITLSGARSGPLTCSDLTAIRTDNNNMTGFGLKGTDAGDTLNVAIGFTGAPVARTYTSGVDASPVLLLVTATTIWTTSNADGNLSLTITSVKTVNSGAGLTKYEVHGTLTATMIAEVSNGSVPPVSVSATF